MSRYKAYEKYKDSGIEWLGDIPEHWDICRLKNLAMIKNGQDYKSVQAEYGYPVMGSGGQFAFASKFMYDKTSVLLGRKGTIDKPLYINEPFWTVDTMYYTEINDSVDAKYLYYLALTIQFARYSTNTALPSMTQEHLGNHYFSVPNKTVERNKIAAFLDYETTKIDDLIDKQQQLIALLKEKRQAVISHAVTKGLNPDVVMKDSGVEWLGYVPAHWDVSRIKYLTSYQVGWTPPTNNDANFDGDNLWANISDLREREIFNTAKKISDLAAKRASMNITPKGSLLYSFKLSVGSVSFAGKDMYTNEAIASFLRESELPLSYLYYVLPKFVIENASTNIYGARILNQELISNADLLSPSLVEAETIAAFLDHETARIDILIEKIESAIQLIQERRTALISAAVTGKIDVRKWLSPSLPHINSMQQGNVDHNNSK